MTVFFHMLVLSIQSFIELGTGGIQIKLHFSIGLEGPVIIIWASQYSQVWILRFFYPNSFGVKGPFIYELMIDMYCFGCTRRWKICWIGCTFLKALFRSICKNTECIFWMNRLSKSYWLEGLSTEFTQSYFFCHLLF